jgi:D-alanyl-D-alanine carboxypeptidase
MEKRICGLLLLLILSFVIVENLNAAPTRKDKSKQEKYKSAVLMDATTGRILYAENADRQVLPASLTKILSLYLAYEAIGQGRAHYQDKVLVSRNAWRARGSRMFIDPGIDITLEELIKGMSVVSANDASVAVAEYLGGDLNGFVDKMNQKARQLGMTGSRFKTPHGLPAKGQVTTARDMAKLSLNYLHRFPNALQIHSMQSYSHHGILQYNRNVLLKRYPGTDGLKTGFVHASGYNIVATAKRGNARLIAVVMGAKTPGIRFRETKRLLDQGFIMVNQRRPDKAATLKSGFPHPVPGKPIFS